MRVFLGVSRAWLLLCLVSASAGAFVVEQSSRMLGSDLANSNFVDVLPHKPLTTSIRVPMEGNDGGARCLLLGLSRDSTILFADEQNGSFRVRATNVFSGEHWNDTRKDAPFPPFGVVSNGKLLATSFPVTNGQNCIYDVRTGHVDALTWCSRFPAFTRDGSTAVCINATNKVLVSMKWEESKVLWTSRMSLDQSGYREADGIVIGDDFDAVWVLDQTHLYTFRLSTGDVLARIDLSYTPDRYIRPVISFDGNVVYLLKSSLLRAIEWRSGLELWNVEISTTASSGVLALTADGNLLLPVAQNYQQQPVLLCLDGKNGTVKWKFSVNSTQLDSMSVVAVISVLAVDLIGDVAVWTLFDFSQYTIDVISGAGSMLRSGYTDFPACIAKCGILSSTDVYLTHVQCMNGTNYIGVAPLKRSSLL